MYFKRSSYVILADLCCLRRLGWCAGPRLRPRTSTSATKRARVCAVHGDESLHIGNGASTKSSGCSATFLFCIFVCQHYASRTIIFNFHVRIRLHSTLLLVRASDHHEAFAQHQFSYRGTACGRQAPRLKASHFGSHTVGPALTAVRPAPQLG